MQDLFFTATATTPYVHFTKKGSFELSGKVISSEESDFWNIIFDWLETYSGNPQTNTSLKIQLDYLNSSSLLQINKLINTISKLNSPQCKVNIIWLYNESDMYMYEMGCELCERNDVPFDMELIPEFV